MFDKIINWGCIIIPIIGAFFLSVSLSSCGVSYCMSTDGDRDLYTPSNYVERTVIDKRIENYGYYVVALDNGDTYYTTFGEYSLIHVHDTILFKKKWNGNYKLIKIK